MKKLVLALVVLWVLPAAAQQMAVKGAVAYTDVLRYDYNGDGKRERVQFWLEFDGQSASGTPGAPGFKPAAGSVRYTLRDADDQAKVVKWRGGLDMEGVPKDTPFPMTDLEFEGKTARFDAFGMRWTVVDGGEGLASDKVIVNDGFRSSEIRKLYAGDLWVGPAK
jgi:hypothetical protein